MCQETPATIIPRIVGVLLGETAPWTGNEILSRISDGDTPCETHFDAALQELIRTGRLTSDTEPDPHMSVFARCKLGYMLVATVVQPLPLPTPPSAKLPPPLPEPPRIPPPVRETKPLLPSPAVRQELIGRLRSEKARLEQEWSARFGPDPFMNGSAAFVKDVFVQSRARGLLPRFRVALERARGRALHDFEKQCEMLVELTDRDGTIPSPVLDAGVRLDPSYYAGLDLDRADKELREGGEGNPANAREILAFLKDALDDASLARHRLGAPKPAEPTPTPTKAPVDKPDTLIGGTFGAYKVVAAIGKGGMGAVYEAVDETLDRRVALKVLHPTFANNREYQDRFLREARNAANAGLDHPNITQVYAAGRQGQHLWLAMQFVRGRTLSKLLEEKKKLPAKEALRIVRQVAEGLAVAHQAKMIHRDIKPDNLMIEESGRMKIMDFGLMRSTDVQKDGLTADGLFVGTLEYASPEQCQDKPMDGRTDLYSLGVVLYELLSGARPYKAARPMAYLTIIPDPKHPPVPLEQQDADVPRDVAALVLRMIAKRPEDRPATAEALVQEIDRVQAVSVPTTPAPRPAEPKPATTSSSARSGMISIAAWLLALAVAIGAAVWFWPKEEAKSSQSAADPEKEAAALLPRVGDAAMLEKLLTSYSDTKAASRAAAQVLADFEKSMPSGDAFELVSAAAWGTWDVDSRDAAGGSALLDKKSGAYILNAPSAKAQVRLLKKLKGAERGYRVRWTCGAGAADSAAFMVAFSFTRWFEISPTGLTLFKADNDQVTTAKKVEFAERVSRGTLHVVPKGSLVLVYLNERLLLALPAKDYALGGGLQLGMSGGSLTLESLRVLDRARD